MNWDAIGAIGEIIGAIAVVATLLYLSIQTNRTRMAVEAGSTTATQEAYSRWRTAFVQNSDLAKAFAKANAGEELSPEEKIQFCFYCHEIFFCAVATLEASTRSGAAHDNALDIDYLKRVFEIIPGAASEWKRLHPIFLSASPKMTTAIDEYLEKNEIG